MRQNVYKGCLKRGRNGRLCTEKPSKSRLFAQGADFTCREEFGRKAETGGKGVRRLASFQIIMA